MISSALRGSKTGYWAHLSRMARSSSRTRRLRDLPRWRISRSRRALTTASVRVPPVAAASSRAKRSASGCLMLKAICLPLYHPSGFADFQSALPVGNLPHSRQARRPVLLHYGLHYGVLEVPLHRRNLRLDHDDGDHLLARIDPGLGAVGSVPDEASIGDAQTTGR